MRIGLLCLLLCLASGGCATSTGCQGPLQPINPPQSKAQSKAATPAADPNASEP